MTTTTVSDIDFADPSTHVDQRLLMRLSRRERTTLRAAVKKAARREQLGPAQARVWHYLADAIMDWGKLADRISGRLIQHECRVDKSQLRRIVARLLECELIVRIPGRGRGVLTIYGLHPRLVQRYFLVRSRFDEPEPTAEKGVTASPLSAASTPLIEKSPDFPPTPQPSSRPSVAEHREEVDDEQVEHLMAALPAPIAPRREHQHRGVSEQLADALAAGYSPDQVHAAIARNVPQRAVWHPAGFIRARLEAMRTVEAPARHEQQQRRAHAAEAAAQRRAERAALDEDRQRTRALWARVPGMLIARMLGGMRATRGRLAQRERIAIRSLGSEIAPVIAAVTDADLEIVLEQWIAEQGWSDVAPVSDDVLANALSALDLQPRR